MHLPKHKLASTAIAFGAAALIAGCAADDIDTPTSEDYDEIAQGLGPIVAEDMAAGGTISTTVELAGGNIPWWMSFDASGEVTGQNGGLSWAVALSCFDAAGALQAACGDDTDSAEASASVDGSLTLGGWSGSLTTDGQWSISGLLGDQITATGQRQVDVDSRFESMNRPVMRNFRLAYDGSYDVTFPREDPPAAVGEAHAMVDAERHRSGPGGTVDAHFVVSVDVTMDGSGVAEVVIDGIARYAVDLRTGAVTRR